MRSTLIAAILVCLVFLSASAKEMSPQWHFSDHPLIEELAAEVKPGNVYCMDDHISFTYTGTSVWDGERWSPIDKQKGRMAVGIERMWVYKADTTGTEGWKVHGGIVGVGNKNYYIKAPDIFAIMHCLLE